MTNPYPALLEHFAISENHLLILKSVGNNYTKSPHCQIKAKNDIEAVSCWLNEYIDSPDTYRLYQRESKRLLLWCAFTAKKPLSDLTRDEFSNYSAFLANPQPFSFWCGPRSSKKEQWRPFIGPLSKSACAIALTVINSLMTYLVDAHYLLHNPLKLIRRKVNAFAKATQAMQSLKHMLEVDEVQAILQASNQLPDSTALQQFIQRRSQFLIPFLMLTGLRAHEAKKVIWNDFRFIQQRWWLMVLGKGDKWRLVPVTEELLHLIKDYRVSLGKPPYPLQTDYDFVFAKRNKKPLSIRRINILVKQLMQLAANTFQDQPDKTQKLNHISVHGFRHHYASMQDKAGIARTIIRDNLGHSNIATTEIYLHSGEIERHNALQKLKLFLVSDTET